MATISFVKLKNWFTGKKQLVKELEQLKNQLQEYQANLEMLEQKTLTWKKKSDQMDLLGDEVAIEKLLNYGSIDSIINILEDYKNLKEAYKMSKKTNQKLKYMLDQKTVEESLNNRDI